MCWWGLGIWQKRQSMDKNEYISVQYVIIVIIVLIFLWYSRPVAVLGELKASALI